MNHGDVKPAILITGRNPEARSVTCREVERRYSHDYLVAEADSPEAGLEELQRLAASREVAAILAAFSSEDPDAIEFLATARRTAPRARRAVVIRWGEFDLASATFAALAAGDIDFYLTTPQPPRDEDFHAALTESLGEWALGTGSGFEAVRIIGERSARSHELRDTFLRNHIPSGFYDADTETGRALLQGLHLEDPSLPVVVGRDVEEFPAARAPYSMETSLPGVFAVGDDRRGSIKGVASGVGSGAIAVQQVHQYLSGRDGRR